MCGCDAAQDSDQSLMIVAEPCTAQDRRLRQGEEPSCHS